jgi:hypothetical protein
MMCLSERWISTLEALLDQIKHLEEVKDRDRLELVKSLRFVLSVLQRSVLGWLGWVENPEVAARFTQEELEKMDKKLSEFTRSFIKYDIEATKLGATKGLKAKKKVKKKKKKRTEAFYV